MVSFLTSSEHICVVVGRQLYGKRTIRKEERNVLFNGYILLPYTKHLMLIGELEALKTALFADDCAIWRASRNTSFLLNKCRTI